VLHDLFPALSWRSAISSADHLSLSANPNRSAKAERPRRICRRDHDKCGLENVPVSWESHPAGLSYPAISARPLISSAAEAMERNPEEVLEAPTRAAARASGSQRIVWSARSPLCTPPPVTLSALSIQVSMAGQTLSPLRWQLAASSHFYGTVKGSRAYSVGQQRSPFQLHWNP